jgi:hypothetical protein
VKPPTRRPRKSRRARPPKKRPQPRPRHEKPRRRRRRPKRSRDRRRRRLRLRRLARPPMIALPPRRRRSRPPKNVPPWTPNGGARPRRKLKRKPPHGWRPGPPLPKPRRGKPPSSVPPQKRPRERATYRVRAVPQPVRWSTRSTGPGGRRDHRVSQPGAVLNLSAPDRYAVGAPLAAGTGKTPATRRNRRAQLMTESVA